MKTRIGRAIHPGRPHELVQARRTNVSVSGAGTLPVMIACRAIRATMAASLLSMGLLVGCRAGGDDLEVVNNRLREQNLDLRDRVAAMEQEIEELKLALRQKSSKPGEPPEAVLLNLPRVTRISLDRLTTIAQTPEGLVARAHVEPEDGRGRFTQMTGRVTLKLVRVPENGDVETVSERVFEPSEVRDAYRSGFMGTHYTIEMPVTLPSEADGETWLLLAEYVDAVTDAKLKAERSVQLPR
jgi:hypothetical protein